MLAVIAIGLAPRLGFLSYPTRRRDIHQRPTPRLGGPALFLAFAGAALWFTPHDAPHLGLIGLCGLTAAVFLYDDRQGMPALLKIGINVLVALVAIVAFRYRIEFINLGVIRVSDLGPLVIPVTLFWIIGMQNTVNLLDGVDGLAAGVVAIVAGTLLVAAASRDNQPDVVILAGALIGACAGFLFFNFHPSQIFMGDSGSQFLGLALALLSVLGVAKVAVAFSLVIPIVALAIPIVDTAGAIIRRRRQGVSIAHADTDHVHHQMLDFGLTQGQTCLLLYCGTAILGAIGLTLFFQHRRILSVVVVFIMVVVSTVLGERLQELERRLPFPGLRRALTGPGVQ